MWEPRDKNCPHKMSVRPLGDSTVSTENKHEKN